MTDSLIAGVLAVAAFAYLYSRRHPYAFVWVAVGYLLAYNTAFKNSRVLAVIAGKATRFISKNSRLIEWKPSKSAEAMQPADPR